jgi:hypothetical protein
VLAVPTWPVIHRRGSSVREGDTVVAMKVWVAFYTTRCEAFYVYEFRTSGLERVMMWAKEFAIFAAITLALIEGSRPAAATIPETQRPSVAPILRARCSTRAAGSSSPTVISSTMPMRSR